MSGSVKLHETKADRLHPAELEEIEMSNYMRTNSCLKVCRAFFMPVALCLLAASNAYANYYPIGEEFVFPSSILIGLFFEVSAISIYFKKSCKLESVKFRISLYAFNIFTMLFLFLAIADLDYLSSSEYLFLISLILFEVVIVLAEGYFIYHVLNNFFLADKKVSFLRCIAVSFVGNIISFLAGAIATNILFSFTDLFRPERILHHSRKSI
ncbi:hypothetical protein [Candidatus Electronema sp. PJ]|uniref:hypothetical protein n=1 Tax=Candidatus Electronema sp. PJ TaxID=3401572 RepID=UPI003AA8A3EC